jgi:hypothetical protein
MRRMVERAKTTGSAPEAAVAVEPHCRVEGRSSLSLSSLGLAGYTPATKPAHTPGM